MFWDILGCFVTFWDVFGHFRIFWDFLGQFGTHSIHLIGLLGSVKI